MAANYAGTAMSALSLLDSCIRGFRGIRLAQTFREDYDTCLLRLDVSCWNLATWYRLRGGEDLQNNRTCAFFLQEIDDELIRARDMSNVYARQNSIDTQAELSATVATQAGTCESAVQLHNHIHGQIRGGSRLSHLGTRMLWVLYRRDELDRLVQSVTEKINHLTTCFPPQPRHMIESERVALVNGIKNYSQLALLKGASVGVDETIRSAAETRLARLEGHSYKNFTVSGYKMTVGNDYEDPKAIPQVVMTGSDYHRFDVSGDQGVVGNRFRYQSK